MTKERELLELAFTALTLNPPRQDTKGLRDEIRTFLAAEPEAKPVLYIKEQELLYIQVLKQESLAQEWKSNLGFVKEDGDVGLYLHPPRPAETEAETIETLKAENFKLASGQCTEGGPWGDQGGTPYCKYAKRKPMTEEEISKLFPTMPTEYEAGFREGIRYAEKHHGITDADV